MKGSKTVIKICEMSKNFHDVFTLLRMWSFIVVCTFTIIMKPIAETYIPSTFVMHSDDSESLIEKLPAP